MATVMSSKSKPVRKHTSKEPQVTVKVLTKAQAREMFGWIPKEKRGENTLISQLKEMGLKTKDDFKQYARTTLMPAEGNSLQNIYRQTVAQRQKEEQKQADIRRTQAKAQAKARFAERKPAALAQTPKQSQRRDQGMKMSQKMTMVKK